MRGQPLLVRLCEAFVENLALILRTALVLGALVFVQELDVLLGPSDPVEEAALPVQSAAEQPPLPPDATADEEPWLTEGVQQALNCTREEFRSQNYDACVSEPSEVYPKSEDSSDDTGFVHHDELVLYAGLIGVAGTKPAYPEQL